MTVIGKWSLPAHISTHQPSVRVFLPSVQPRRAVIEWLRWAPGIQPGSSHCIQLASLLLLHVTLHYVKEKVMCFFNFCKLSFPGIQTPEYWIGQITVVHQCNLLYVLWMQRKHREMKNVNWMKKNYQIKPRMVSFKSNSWILISYLIYVSFRWQNFSCCWNILQILIHFYLS